MAVVFGARVVSIIAIVAALAGCKVRVGPTTEEIKELIVGLGAELDSELTNVTCPPRDGARPIVCTAVADGETIEFDVTFQGVKANVLTRGLVVGSSLGPIARDVFVNKYGLELEDVRCHGWTRHEIGNTLPCTARYDGVDVELVAKVIEGDIWFDTVKGLADTAKLAKQLEARAAQAGQPPSTFECTPAVVAAKPGARITCRDGVWTLTLAFDPDDGRFQVVDQRRPLPDP